MLSNKNAKLRLVTRRVEERYVTTHHCIQWEYESGETREPVETETEYAYPGSFIAAGKRYSSWQELCHVKKDAYGHICQDIYGREVFAEWERYPCFDVYDRMYENRYYRWFYIWEGDKLTCVYRDDGRGNIRVTEDVAEMKEWQWKAMKDANWQSV